MSTLETVNTLKKALVKEMSKAEPDAERLGDVLGQLGECKIDLSILTETLIGKTVNKLKNHEKVGSEAKQLIKSWKAVANPEPAKKEEAQRRGSMNSAASSSPEDEWKHLPPLRQNICKKFHEILVAAKPYLIKSGINDEVVDHLCGPRAAEIEASIVKMHHGKGIREDKAYSDKARSLAFNLKKNQALCQQVILGEINTDQLVEMGPEELASEEILKKKAEEAQKLIDSKRLDWEQANEDKINEMCGIKGDLLKASLFTCGRCKSTKTTSTQKQTRSADEPMTVFVFCTNCGKRWKC